MTNRWSRIAIVLAPLASVACGTSDAPDQASADASLPPTADAAPAPAPDADLPSLDATTEADARTPTDASDATVGDAGPPSLDVTFFAFGDPQYGGGPYDKNAFNILALNAAPHLVWPAGEGFASEGTPVGSPRGVVIAGDLTQNGQTGRNRDPIDGEWYLADRYAFDLHAEYGLTVAKPDIRAELGLFLRDYGLRGGDGKSPITLDWRVFEGYGNHDFDILEKDWAHYGGEAPARDVVSIRNRVRATWPEMRRFAPGNAGHYSWEWGGIHIVHVNLVAADAPPLDGDSNSHLRDPEGALAFLRDDLAAEVAGSCRPVVVVMHYGFDAFGDQSRWWNDGQRKDFFRVVRPYNVIALLHGHTHETRSYSVTDETGKAYDVISLGSPYYSGQSTNGGRGHFAAFHVAGDHLDAADVSWEPTAPDPDEGDNKDLWTGKKLNDLRFQTTTTFADGWGGWKLSKTISRGPCSAGDAGDAGD